MDQKILPHLSRRSLLSFTSLAGACAVSGVLSSVAFGQDAAPAAPAAAAADPAAPPVDPAAAPAATAPAATAAAATAPADANAPAPPVDPAAAPLVAAPAVRPLPPARPPSLTAAEPKPAALAGGDLTILNFALGLEHLEAAFYAQVLAAHSRHGFLEPHTVGLAQQLAAIEATHVSTLRTAITAGGGTPVQPMQYAFPPSVFVSPVAFTWFGFTLEEIGIGAYLGAIGHLESSGLRAAAASIYGAEVRHAAILRSQAGFESSPRYFEGSLSVEQVQGLVAPYQS